MQNSIQKMSCGQKAPKKATPGDLMSFQRLRGHTERENFQNVRGTRLPKKASEKGFQRRLPSRASAEVHWIVLAKICTEICIVVCW